MKRVIIIGGGFAGARIANSLQGHFSVALIDTKNFFEFTPGITRTLVQPSYRRFIEIHHRKYLKKASFRHDSVIGIDKQFVYTGKGEKILYDYTIIASGSRYNMPFKGENIFLADRAKDLVDSHKRIHKSKRILVVGGGLVGVEIAAEIVSKYKNKKVTLIQADDRIIPRNSSKSADYCKKYLTDRGVKIILGQKVVAFKKNLVVTDKKTMIKADMTLICTGIKPNSEFLKKHFSKNLDEKEHVIVNDKLQACGLTNVFAVGDINNVMEEKTAQAAEKQSKIVIKNLKNLEKNKELLSYHPKKKAVVISLGKWDGILEWKNFVMTGKIPALLKWLIQIKTMLRYRIRAS
ncbi:MAG: FAD-dependent oxidoreductase [Nanoarchaeota archaeon]